MKMVKKLPLLLLFAAPFFLPVQSRAGDGKDKGQNQDQNQNQNQDQENENGDNPSCATGTGNSVPLNGGVVFLTLAGLGLGARLIYKARTRKEVA